MPEPVPAPAPLVTPTPTPTPEPALTFTLTPTPDEDRDQEASPSLRDRLRGHSLTMVLAFGGIIVSAAVAALVSAYLDIWSVKEPPPGAPRISANAEAWWDLASEERAVYASADAPDLRGRTFHQNDPEDDLDTLVAQGGIDAGMMRVRLILTNFTRTPASITGVRALVRGEHPLPGGPLYACGGAQGGSDISRIKLDLKRPERAAVEYGDEGEVLGRYPSARVQVAAQGDPAHFDIEIRAGLKVYDFVLEITYRQGERQERLVVDRSGSPFVLAPALSDHARALRCNVTTFTWDAP